MELLTQNINKIILQDKKDSSLFTRVCREIQKNDGYKFVWIGLLNGREEDNSKAVNPVAFYGLNGRGKRFISGLLEDLNRDGLLEQPFRSKKYKVYRFPHERNIELSQYIRKTMDGNGITSSVIIPLKYNNDIVGLLSVFSSLDESFKGSELKALQEISKIISTDTRRLKLEMELKNTLGQLQRTLYETIDAITLMSEIKDPYTSGHQKKVALIASAISDELGLPKDIIDGIYISGLLHDVGKISVPNDILAKPGGLNEGEFFIVKKHPEVSYAILKNIEFPWPVAQIVIQHHERIDGSGYPKGIISKNICIEAKILSVADVVEAMTAHRPYRPALGLKKATSEIIENKNKLYDKKIVEACIKVIEEKKIEL